MNIFVYDVYLDKYKKTVKNIEETLNKLNLQGKILYLKNIKNLKESLISEIDNGAKTVVSVGNNETVNKIINILANISTKMPIAVIPVGPINSISRSLGIPNEKEACYVLSSRRIEKINLATANDTLFVHKFFIKNEKTRGLINNSYEISPLKKGEFFVYNIPPAKESPKNIKITPQDNILNLSISTKKEEKTYIPVNKITINNPKETGFLDDLIRIDSPIEIKSSDKSLDFIVGKERYF